MIRARHEGHPCVCEHCGEPVVRLQDDVSAAVSVWVHTPDRRHCIDQLTRQQLPTVAGVAGPSVLRDPARVWRLRSRVSL